MGSSDNNRKQLKLPPKQGDSPREPMGWRGPGKTVLFWVSLILIATFLYSLYSQMSSETAAITYSELVEQIEAENVAE
ncbi:MAG: ATP-dependent metallopeptidase FtsH/Yme1/Tma family protein, partial [Candidatus Zixiibacteriota bacterium]